MTPMNGSVTGPPQRGQNVSSSWTSAAHPPQLAIVSAAPDVRASAGAALGGWTTAMTSRFGSRTARAARTTSGAATVASAALLRR